MAISLKTAGTWARVVADPSSVTIPGSPAAGDRMYLFASWKTYSITVADPSGWTLLDDFSDGAVAAGNGTGSVHNAVWYRDWQSGDANPSLNWSAAPTEAHAVIMLWQKGGADVWGTPAAVHAAIAAADPWAATASATVDVPDASVVMSLVGLRDDSTTIARSTTTAIEDDGSPDVTWNGNYVESPAAHFNSTTGNDMAGDLGHRFVTTGAAGVSLTSTGDPVAAETGTVTWVVQGLVVPDTALAGSSAGSSTAAASLTTQVALAGSSVGSAAPSSALTTAIRFAGAAAAAAAAAAVLTTGIALAGLSAGQASASGAMSSLVGTSVGGSSAAAALTTQIALAGAAPGSSSSAAALTTSIPLAGASPGAGGVSASLTTQVALGGSAAGQAAADGALTTSIPLAGQSAGASSAAGDLATQVALAGQSAGEAWAQGFIAATGDTALAGAAVGQSSASSSLTTAIPLGGSASGTSAATGALTTSIALTGSAAGSSTAAGVLASTGDTALMGSAPGSSSATGILSDMIAFPLSATITRASKPSGTAAAYELSATITRATKPSGGV